MHGEQLVQCMAGYIGARETAVPIQLEEAGEWTTNYTLHWLAIQTFHIQGHRGRLFRGQRANNDPIVHKQIIKAS